MWSLIGKEVGSHEEPPIIVRETCGPGLVV